MNQCPSCKRGFTTPQGLGLHFKHNKCKGGIMSQSAYSSEAQANRYSGPPKRENLIVKKRGGGERLIPWHKWVIDTRTSHGEDADLFELMPNEGRRYIDRKNIIRKESYIKKCKCGADADVWNDYCTSRGHGFSVICKNSHYGPHANTFLNAVKKWNKVEGDYEWNIPF